MAWQVGPNSLSAGQSQRWFFAWGEGDPGIQVIMPHPISPGAELRWEAPGVILSDDCRITYFLTIRNVGPTTAEYHWRGAVP